MKRHVGDMGFLEQYVVEDDTWEDVFCWRDQHRMCSDDCAAFWVEKFHAHCSALPPNHTDLGELSSVDEEEK